MNVGSVNKGKSIPGAADGFTLTELLVVMGIVALLCAIVFPVFVKAKEGARVSECLSNMRQIGAGLHMYIEEYNGRLPAAVSFGSPGYWNDRHEKTVQELLSRYVSQAVSSKVVNGYRVYSSAGVFACPSDYGPQTTSDCAYGIHKGIPVWKSTGCSYEYYASNQEDWERSGLSVPWTSLSPLVATTTGNHRIGAAISDIQYPTRKAVIGDLLYWHYGDKTPDEHLAYCNTLYADGHAARVRGSAHLEARLEKLRPWHTATEISNE